ncbi:hypothetical protein [Arthrobacter sp. ISL-28]|uniref:hypothetical protein n=1 Tax=Arthrobacter sp. ISL-28 TaxID=2819108 RepID=UPI001BE580F7|nr:hypothetical protein [Arthrobacter sp. ISL-28]MBT2522540.1 hypothetical protein [Arthrobacter sp. ISL-28]
MNRIYDEPGPRMRRNMRIGSTLSFAALAVLVLSGVAQWGDARRQASSLSFCIEGSEVGS